MWRGAFQREDLHIKDHLTEAWKTTRVCRGTQEETRKGSRGALTPLVEGCGACVGSTDRQRGPSDTGNRIQINFKWIMTSSFFYAVSFDDTSSVHAVISPLLPFAPFLRVDFHVPRARGCGGGKGSLNVLAEAFAFPATSSRALSRSAVINNHLALAYYAYYTPAGH